jgi:hypothetical protein
MSVVNTNGPSAPGTEKPDPRKMLLLDLLYPAVLGALIVFLFARLAAGDLQTLEDPSTNFGVILAVFYAAGFVAAKLTPQYKWSVAAVDFLSSILMFVCFYILGLSQETLQPVNYRHFYIALLIVVLSPMLRRIIVLGHRPHFRHGLAVTAAAIVVLALLVDITHGPLPWLSPTVIALLLYVLLVIYFIHIRIGGIVAE